MLGTQSLEELLPTLPLPLAQLGRRVLHAKIAAERYAAAYYLAEATLKLAAAARIGLFLAHGGAPTTLHFELLVDATMARWCVLFEEVCQALAALPQAALLPLADTSAALTAAASEQGAIAAYFARCAELRLVEPALLERQRRRGLLGLLAVIAARGPTLGAAQPKQDGDLLVAAVSEALESPALFGGLTLARVGLLAPTASWESLTGFEPQPLVPSPSSDGVGAGRLYFVGPGARIALHPLVAGHEDGLGRQQVGFLNRTVRRTRKGASGSVHELRRIDFLDYASGELFGDADAEEALRRLFAGPSSTSAPRDEEATAAGAKPRPTLDDPGRDEVLEANAVLGDFQLLGELGKGGMGVVYKALQLSVRRIVALKVLPASLAEDPMMLARFQREIAALRRCDHPNVVKVLTAGEESGRHYYAMELVEGADLGQTLRVLSGWSAGGTRPLREGHLQAALSQSGSRARSVEQDEDSAAAATVAGHSHRGATPAPQDVPPPPIEEGRPMASRLAELFADAASGLAHLHEAGVIHRDIKPGNLMLTSDAQRIVIMDLGLARLDDASRQLTSADIKVLGTLRYMPPEQLDRKRDALDHRADLYSLGVTLYELATGHRFFEGDSEQRIIQQILNEEPVPPLQVAPHLPRDLATILTVATAKLPERRYQSARALEADLRAVAAGRPILARPPGALDRLAQWARHHRPAVAAGVAVSLLGCANAVAYVSWREHRSQLCRGAEERLVGVWDARIKQAVKTAFAATGKSYATAALHSVEAILDARAVAWSAMHRDACEATRLRGEQSEELLDRRMSCLQERREELRTLAEVFTRADAPVVERAVAAVEGLSPLAGCADTAALLGRAAPPRDPATAAKVAAVRDDLARSVALEQAGRYAEGLARSRAAVLAAQAIQDKALLSEAIFMRGKLEYASSEFDAAEKSFYDAWWTAEAAGHDELKARAASQLIFLVGYVRARHKEALQLDRHAAAVDQRLAGNLALEAGRHNHLGAVLRAMGDYDRALVEFEQSLAIKQRLAGSTSDSTDLAETLNNLGNVLDDKGDHERALEALGRALAIREKILGADHPDVARTLNNLGVAYYNKGDKVRAFENYTRALAIEERSLGPDDPTVAMSLNNLGGLLADRGDKEAALAHHRRALAIWQKALGLEHPNVAISINNIGEELRSQKRYREALVEYARALAILHKAVGTDHPAVAMVLANQGQAELGLHSLPAANAALEKVFAICDKKTCEPAVISEASFAFAETLWQLGQKARARSFAVRAKETYGKTPGNDAKIGEINAWLARH